MTALLNKILNALMNLIPYYNLFARSLNVVPLAPVSITIDEISDELDYITVSYRRTAI